jgi:hypothetical protein
MNFKEIKILGLILCVTTTACTMFAKNNSSNEMEELTSDVLKRKEGIDIKITPVDENKK